MSNISQNQPAQSDWSGTHIPETGLKVDYPEICAMFGDEEIAAIHEALKAPVCTLSAQTKAFQEEFAAYTGARHAFAVSSATAALEMAAVLAGVDEGDEAIVPAITFASANLGVLRLGAKCVFADIDPRTYCVTAETIAARITPKTKAIYVVHLYGLPADMDPIMKLAQERGLAVIEDCAHAPGAEYKGRRTGSIGDYGCFSFHTAKNMSTLGEGGMLTTNSDEAAADAAPLRWTGMEGFPGQEKYWLPYLYDIRKVRGRWPFNFCMNEVQAAVGRVQLRRLPGFNDRRRAIARRLIDGLKDMNSLQLPVEPDGRKHAYHLFPLLFDGSRDALIAMLHDQFQIRCVPLYPPVYYFSAYREMGYERGLCPNAEWMYDRLVNLPMTPALTDAQVDYMIDSVKKAAAELAGTAATPTPVISRSTPAAAAAYPKR